jgi:hypothetical protein
MKISGDKIIFRKKKPLFKLQKKLEIEILRLLGRLLRFAIFKKSSRWLSNIHIIIQDVSERSVQTLGVSSSQTFEI